MIGGQLLNIYTDFHALESGGGLLEQALSPSHPQWIGAWWLGFLLIFILSYIFAAIISFFPAKVQMNSTSQGAELEIKEMEVQHQPRTDKNDNNLLDSHQKSWMEGIPQTIYGLLTNIPFMGITFGATMDGFLLAGQAAFLPKYLESQFDLTASQAAFLVGAVVVPAGALGTLMGGFALKKFDLNRIGAMKLYLCCQVVILPLYFGFFFNCPSPALAGVNVPYLNESLVQNTSPQCNLDCNCSHKQGKSYLRVAKNQLETQFCSLFCRICL